MLHDIPKQWEKVADNATNFQDPFDVGGRDFLDRVILREIGNIKDKKVVDIGAGDGRFADKLRSKGGKVLAVEVSEKMLESAKQKYPDLDIFLHDFANDKFPVGSSFDYAVLELVVMFVKNIDSLLKNVHDALTSDGEAIVILLHPFLIWNSALKSSGKINFEGKEDYFTEKVLQMKSDNIDLSYFSRSISWYVKKFIKSGFKIVDIDEPVAKGTGIEMVENFGGEKDLPYILIFKLAKNN